MSSKGRAVRCAGWYQDFLNAKGINSSTQSKAVILSGGIKDWLDAYKHDPLLTEGYDASFWPS
jgi:hypothetical protein